MQEHIHDAEQHIHDAEEHIHDVSNYNRLHKQYKFSF